jgi:hypothetical protein
MKLPLRPPKHLPLQLHLDILPILLLLLLLLAPIFRFDSWVRVNDSIAQCLLLGAELSLHLMQFVFKRLIVLDKLVADVHTAPIAKAVGVVGRAGVRYGAEGAGVGVAYLVCKIP